MSETCRLRRGEGYEACPDEAGAFLGSPEGPIFSRKEAPREEKRQLEKPDKMEHGDYPTARWQRNMAVPSPTTPDLLTYLHTTILLCPYQGFGEISGVGVTNILS